MHQRLITSDGRIVIDIAGLGHAAHRMDQQVRLVFSYRPHRQLEVSAMHRIPRLEGEDVPPARARELRAKLRRGQSESAEIVVLGQPDALDLAADIRIPGGLHEICKRGMLGVRCSEYRLGLFLLIRFPYIGDFHYGHHHSLDIAKGYRVADRTGVGKLLTSIERNRLRPERAVGEAHIGANRVVICPDS